MTVGRDDIISGLLLLGGGLARCRGAVTRDQIGVRGMRVALGCCLRDDACPSMLRGDHLCRFLWLNDCHSGVSG